MRSWSLGYKGKLLGGGDGQISRERMDYDRPCQSRVARPIQVLKQSFATLTIHFQVQELLAESLKKLNRITILQCSELDNCLMEFASQATTVCSKKF